MIDLHPLFFLAGSRCTLPSSFFKKSTFFLFNIVVFLKNYLPFYYMLYYSFIHVQSAAVQYASLKKLHFFQVSFFVILAHAGCMWAWHVKSQREENNVQQCIVIFFFLSVFSTVDTNKPSWMEWLWRTKIYRLH